MHNIPVKVVSNQKANILKEVEKVLLGKEINKLTKFDEVPDERSMFSSGDKQLFWEKMASITLFNKNLGPEVFFEMIEINWRLSKMEIPSVLQSNLAADVLTRFLVCVYRFYTLHFCENINLQWFDDQNTFHTMFANILGNELLTWIDTSIPTKQLIYKLIKCDLSNKFSKHIDDA